MSAATKKSFTVLLEPDGTSLRWVIARVPFDIAKVWPVRKGRRVRGTIEGFAFRTSLFPDPRGEGHVLLVNKQMQRALVRVWEQRFVLRWNLTWKSARWCCRRNWNAS